MHCIYYKDRRKIVKLYEEWLLKESDVIHSLETLIAFLQIKGYLKEKKIKADLEKENDILEK